MSSSTSSTLSRVGPSETAAPAGTTSNLCGLWQWSHGTAQFESDEWGDYLPEINSTIEAAYQAQKENVQVPLGTRTLTIEFQHMLQVDYVNGRVREVRRQEVEACKMPGCQMDDETEEDVCAICHEPHNTIQATRVLPCGHRFHAMCIDMSAERYTACPLCRASIPRRYIGCPWETAAGGGDPCEDDDDDDCDSL
mmetsp:Transcript_9758/g.11294  ORF Transcript_9758/g.11294 Transcript_9758/m.11294 type:complete len:195 (-) Transcript_9758:111-695(-)